MYELQWCCICYHGIYFWFMTKSEATDRMKNPDPSEKTWASMIIKKSFIMVMLNNATEAVTYQQR